MKITLSKVSHNEKLSEETYCFSATVCIDGKASFLVKNRGTGGSNHYDSLAHESVENVIKEACTWCDSLPSEITNIKNRDGSFFLFKPDLDSVISDLIHDYLNQKKLLRMLKTKWVFANKGGVFALSKQAPLHQVERECKTSVILNNLSFESALEMYKQCG